MKIFPTELPDVLLLEPVRRGDDRGMFVETYRRAVLEDAGASVEFVQDNHSRSAKRGTIRGLHFQREPRAQDKLVRVVRGCVLDVVVDIRPSSPTFGRHVAIELSADNWRQLFVPRGFAHGFATLTDEAEVLYKCSDYYSPEHEGGLRWDDPALAIDWPFEPGESLTINARDSAWLDLRDQPAWGADSASSASSSR